MFYNNHHVQIDLHGMKVETAGIELTRYISRLNENVKEVTVIHGYRGGNALMEFVRYEFRHPRIIDVKYTDNYGETVLVLD